MVRFLNALDRFLSAILPVLYLVGTATATISYFSDGALPDTIAVTGLVLGFAVESHTWLQVRRCRESWSLYSRTPHDDAQYPLVASQLKVAIGLLALLGTFSFFSSLLFLQGWHPASEFIPVVWQRLIRAVVIPALVIASSVLAPLHEDPSAELAKASATILRQTLKDVADQVRTQIAEAKASGAPLTPIAAALLLDNADPRGARRLRTIHDGLAESRGELVPHRPGPRSGDGPAPVATQRRRKKNSDPEGTVRRLLAADPRMPLSQIMKRARVSMAQAGQLRKMVLAEMDDPQQAAS
jgi:hypothetical protein